VSQLHEQRFISTDDNDIRLIDDQQVERFSKIQFVLVTSSLTTERDHRKYESTLFIEKCCASNALCTCEFGQFEKCFT